MNHPLANRSCLVMSKFEQMLGWGGVTLGPCTVRSKLNMSGRGGVGWGQWRRVYSEVPCLGEGWGRAWGMESLYSEVPHLGAGLGGVSVR